ncbi:hypothetical protein [Poseidonocella sp. HB161398]|uniref:hypothetical protein n=1 Tax=Poseidonocella sp. HB161398 TaxID=2320855 RepID=UPI00148708CA|nr:hypothetical protein [Poseidonocella sp. HB161398]
MWTWEFDPVRASGKSSGGGFEDRTGGAPWLPGPVAGKFFYLYIITDIWSRKITGWEVHERETAENAAALLERAVWAEKCVTSPLVLHAEVR